MPPKKQIKMGMQRQGSREGCLAIRMQCLLDARNPVQKCFASAGATTWGTNQLTVDRRSLEAAGRVRPAQAAADARVLFSCGVPMSGVDLRVIHPDTRAPCDDGCVGEVWLSSPCVTAGYFNKPDLNAQVFQVRA